MVGVPKRTYIIAEAGVNHNGSLEMAMELIDAAAKAGADAIKFQTFKAERLVTAQARKAAYQLSNNGVDETQFEMLKSLEIDDDDYEILIQHCEKKGIDFLSTPFDTTSAELLIKRFQLSAIKISSGDITNGPLLLTASRLDKPVLLSTGMSTLAEIEMALGVLAFGYTQKVGWPSLNDFYEAYTSEEGQAALRDNVTLLHCTSEYPVPYEEVHLRVLETLKQAFQLPVGYSDHTLGIAVPLAAVAMGATVIEKHLTLNRELPGPDHQASLEPEELKAMVTSIRQIEMAMGSPIKSPTSSEKKNQSVVRKSLVTSKPVKKGEPFTQDNLTVKRPGDGVSPMYYWDWLGKVAERDYEADEVVKG